MRATKIEVRTADLRAGRHVNGAWQPAGQLLATLWLEDPGDDLAKQIVAAITRLGDEEVVATVEGRQSTDPEVVRALDPDVWHESDTARVEAARAALR